MATYIALVNFTDQRCPSDSPDDGKSPALVNAGSNLGVRVKEIYWTLGAFDAVFTVDAPG